MFLFIDNAPSVLQLCVKGYSDKQYILLRKIMEKMTTFEIDEKRFDIIKEAVRSNCDSFSQSYKVLIIDKKNDLQCID